MHKQSFLNFEADKMFLRNKQIWLNKNYEKDEIFLLLRNKIKKSDKLNILEVGCAAGYRLEFLKKKFPKCNFYGIDPSKIALNSNNKKKINLKLATADHLPFADKKFDIIIYGFCLYLCDTVDLFKIASETYRTTKDKSLIIIADFIQDKVKYNKYKYVPGLFSRKMDYVNMFTWHPNINLINRKKKIEGTNKKFSKKNREVSIVCLKKG